MRIRSVEVDGFRGWSQPMRIDLDANVVVVRGQNGAGKTSLFDAVLWALTGELGRFGDERHDVVSKFAESGIARVELVLTDAQSDLSIVRTYDGHADRVQTTEADEVLRGDAASAHIIRRLWPAGAADEQASTFSDALATAVYLQQDEVQAFLHSRSEQERFSAVSSLFGTHRVGEIQRQLERERQSWTRTTNETKDELEQLQTRVGQLEELLGRLSGEPNQLDERRWAAWWRGIARYVGDIPQPEADDSGASERLSGANHSLDTALQNAKRRVERVAAALSAWQSAQDIPEVTDVEIESAKAAAAQLRDHVVSLEGAVASAQQAAHQEEARIVGERDQAQDLRNLATVALRHLGETCPVCNQPYDRDATADRLGELATPADMDAQRPALAELRRLEGELRTRRSELRAAESLAEELRGRSARRQGLMERAAADAAGIVEQVDTEALTAALMAAETALNDIGRLQGEGQALALAVARNFEAGRRSQVERELQSAREERDGLAGLYARRADAGDRATRLIEAIRSSGQQLAASQIAGLDPLLSRIYSRIDPHPAFRVARFVASYPRGRGHMTAMVRDPEEDRQSLQPIAHLSSSQANALALSIFMALNLGMARPHLQVAMLDDPLQSLDEINLLGVVDLLRRCKDTRQVLISTHDEDFADLLVRKLRPVTSTESLISLLITDWNRGGPSIQSTRLTAAPTPWKVVA